MHSKIALVGPGASGKDHLRQKFQDRGFRFGVSHTTRPPRDGEVAGKDYHYVSTDEFIKMVDAGRMVEYQMFNGWYYGMTVEVWEEADIMILNAEAVELLEPEFRDSLFVIYMDIDRDIRLERLNAREDFDNPERRIKEDDKQFRNFSDFDCKITNEDF